MVFDGYLALTFSYLAVTNLDCKMKIVEEEVKRLKKGLYNEEKGEEGERGGERRKKKEKEGKEEEEGMKEVGGKEEEEEEEEGMKVRKG